MSFLQEYLKDNHIMVDVVLNGVLLQFLKYVTPSVFSVLATKFNWFPILLISISGYELVMCISRKSSVYIEKLASLLV